MTESVSITTEECAARLMSESGAGWSEFGAVLHGLADDTQVFEMVDSSNGSADALSSYLVSLGVNVVLSEHLSASERSMVNRIMSAPAVALGTVAQETILGVSHQTASHQVSRVLRALGAHWHALHLVQLENHAAIRQHLDALADAVETNALRQMFERMVADHKRRRSAV